MIRPNDSNPDPTEPNRDIQPADHIECNASHCPVEVLAPESDYAEFGLWMDAELEKLVALWAPSAAPQARQAANRSKFGR